MARPTTCRPTNPANRNPVKTRVLTDSCSEPEIESGPARGTERQVLNGAGRANLGQSLNVVEDRLDLVGALGRVAQDKHLHGQDPFRLEPQRNVQKPREGAQQQARSDQENHRQGDLRDDQSAAPALVSAGIRRSAGAVARRCLDIKPRDLPGRNQPAQQGGQQGGRDREAENAKVERSSVNLSQGNRPSRQIDQQLAGPTPQEKSSGATRARQQQALEAEKLNQTPTARTQRQPDGEFASPPDAARQKKSRHVGADDQQDE